MLPFVSIVAPRALAALSRLAPISIQDIAIWPCVVSRSALDARTARHEAIVRVDTDEHVLETRRSFAWARRW